MLNIYIYRYKYECIRNSQSSSMPEQISPQFVWHHKKKIARAKAPNWQVGNLKRFLSIFIFTNFRATMYCDSVLEITGNHQVHHNSTLI